MKRQMLIIMALLAATVGIGRAQFVQLGVKGGLLITTTDLKFETASLVDRFKDRDTRAGFELGFQVRVNLPGRFLFQPEIVFNRSVSEFDTRPEISGEDNLRLKNNWIDVPLLVGYRFGPLRLMAGPSFRFPVAETFETRSTSVEVEPRLKNFVMGYQAGVGVDLGRLTIDARFCGNFTALTNRKLTEDYLPGVKINENKFAISVGYMLFRSRL